MEQLLLIFLSLCDLSWQLPFTSNGILPRASAAHSFDLTRVPGTGWSEAAHVNNLQVINRRQKYTMSVSVEGQSFNLEVDTGSSDTWFIGTGFQCYDEYMASPTFTFAGLEPEDVCNFGPTYTPSTGFEPIINLYLSTAYAGGTRRVEGPIGYASITLGDLTLDQLIGVPNVSSFPAYGSHQQSGLIGLAFPALTSAFNARPPTTDTLVPYTPAIESLFDQHQDLYPQFALALSRDKSSSGNGGVLTFGGLPDNTSTVNYASAESTSARLQLVDRFSATDYTFWSILIDHFIYGSTTSDQGLQVIVDSGAAFLYVPYETTKYMNYLWNPPASHIDDNGLWYIDCAATMSGPVGIAIGGRDYLIRTEDLIGQNADGTCFSLITAGSEDGYLIGDPFLKNVVANFNIQAKSIAFWPRNEYES